MALLLVNHRQMAYHQNTSETVLLLAEHCKRCGILANVCSPCPDTRMWLTHISAL